MPSRRVLHVTQVYAGGIRRAITSLTELTPEAEHHLLWAGDEDPDPAVPFASIHTMPQTPTAMLTAVRRVREVVREVKPDLVHAHSSFGGVYARLANVDVPVYYEPHCYKFDDRQQSVLKRQFFRFAERFLAKRSAKTIVLSPHEAMLAKELDAAADTHFVPNVATVRPTTGAPAVKFETGRDVLMIGRLTGQKDPDYFARVAEQTRKRDSSTTFRWVGDGEAGMRERLECAGVTVMGWLTGDDLRAELARPAVYFHSAHYEGFPLSLLDAAAFEHPVIVRSIPTYDGLSLVQADTPERSADLIIDVLDRGPAYERAVGGSKRLDETMNREAQRESLRALYRTL